MLFFKRSPKIEAVVFDVGGVLVDADLERYLVYGAEIFGCRPEQLQEAAQPFVVQLECGKLTSTNFWEAVGRALEERGWGKAVPARKFDGFWKGILRDTVKVKKDVLDLLPRIQRRATVGGLSNTIEEHANYLEKMGVYKLFKDTILSYQVGMRKPDAAIYKLTASRLRVPVGKCLLVDDSSVNTDGAAAAGMRAHHFQDVDDLVRDLAGCKLL